MILAFRPALAFDAYDYGIPTTKEGTLADVSRDLTDALVDFENAITRSATTQEALSLHLTLTTVTAKAIRLEKLALDKADALCQRNS
jgi:hypothetical protein